MRVTPADVIKSGERELIDTIIGDLDWSSIEAIVRERHKLQIKDDVEYRQGDIIVHQNQVAYKLDFDVKMTLSIVFDRNGNCLSMATSDDVNHEGSEELAADPGDTEPEPLPASATTPDMFPAADPEKLPRENFSKMASHIAEMISEINDEP